MKSEYSLFPNIEFNITGENMNGFLLSVFCVAMALYLLQLNESKKIPKMHKALCFYQWMSLKDSQNAKGAA